MVHIGNSWDDVLKDEFTKEYYLELREFLKKEYSTATIYPNMFDIFNALKYTPVENVKAVILGQDPYHEPGQAHGLCFSVQDGTALPPSLKNIYKEMHDDLGITQPDCGDLTKWAKQGVLLLNTVLTVRRGIANSHKGKGWEIFTDRIVQEVNRLAPPSVFLLWGANARAKAQLVTNPKHLVLSCAHPSPLSAYNGFFGCKHFSKANAFLKQNGRDEINWQL